VPEGTALGSHPVTVVHAAGCQSQESLSLEVVAGATRCGLLGIEGFALLGFAGWARRRIRL